MYACLRIGIYSDMGYFNLSIISEYLEKFNQSPEIGVILARSEGTGRENRGGSFIVPHICEVC